LLADVTNTLIARSFRSGPTQPSASRTSSRAEPVQDE
jgi:hypothetical protein